MARQITKELAKKIVKKLKGKKGAQTEAHQSYDVFYDSSRTLLITNLTIRHGSERDKGHDHMEDELFLSPHNAKELARCNLSRDQWIDNLVENGHLVRPDDPAANHG